MRDTGLKIGIVMDPIGSITPYKDSSLAMLLEAGRRGAEIHYFEQSDLRMLSGKAMGRSTQLTVRDNDADWFTLGMHTSHAFEGFSSPVLKQLPEMEQHAAPQQIGSD